jgi:hypothetical protein
VEQAGLSESLLEFSFEELLLTRLECVECGGVPVGRASGWISAICGGYDLGPPERVVLCPDCASREELG